MSLSVCLLTRNQEEHLAGALHSVAGVADQVIVADTGSRDRTVPIATELGAEIHHFAWDDDFAAGRNFTVARARGDWVLWLNADEELDAASHRDLRARLGQDGVFGYFVRILKELQPGDSSQFSEAADLRLFRRRPDVRFVGRMHPAFEPGLVAAVKAEGFQVPQTGIVLRAHFNPEERDEAKLRFRLRLLEKELQDRPGRLHYLLEYARTLLMLNDPKGHAVYAEAAEQLLPQRQAPTAPSVSVQTLFYYLLTVPPEQCRSRLTPDEARDLALRWFPRSPGLLYLNAEHFFRRGEYRQAAELLERLVMLGRTGGYDRSRTFDPGLVGEDALINLAACYRQLGDLERAEHCYRQLLDSTHYRSDAARQLAAVQEQRRQQMATAGPRPPGWFFFDTGA
jgi:glycosyltransferase involved in cell wall biosynthesis